MLAPKILLVSAFTNNFGDTRMETPECRDKISRYLTRKLPSY